MKTAPGQCEITQELIPRADVERELTDYAARLLEIEAELLRTADKLSTMGEQVEMQVTLDVVERTLADISDADALAQAVVNLNSLVEYVASLTCAKVIHR